MMSASAVRTAAAATALAAGTIVWSALPLTGARPGARPALVAAVAFGVLTIAQLITDPSLAASRSGGYAVSLPSLTTRAWASVRALPWPQAMTITVLVLEALHGSRPWHTVVLAAVLVGFLLALHLAETAASPAVLRPQVPLLACGLGLSALSAGAAALQPAGSGWLAVFAAIAAVVVAGLALPV